MVDGIPSDFLMILRETSKVIFLLTFTPYHENHPALTTKAFSVFCYIETSQFSDVFIVAVEYNVIITTSPSLSSAPSRTS